MSKAPRAIRLFVAVDPPVDLTRRMLKTLADLDPPDHRVTPVEQAHLTVHFIGETPPDELDAAIESVQRSAAGLPTGEIRPEKLISLPARGPARLIALQCEAPPALLELRARLVRRFARQVRRQPNDRFLPHITLCRFRRPARIPRIERETNLPPFALDAVRLMRSEMLPTGARHTEIARFALDPTG